MCPYRCSHGFPRLITNHGQTEVAGYQDEERNYRSELFCLKAAQEEAVQRIDIIKRKNKNLPDEIKDLHDHLEKEDALFMIFISRVVGWKQKGR